MLGFTYTEWAKALAGALLLVVIGWAFTVVAILAGTPS